MKEILPILIIGVLIVSGFGAVALHSIETQDEQMRISFPRSEIRKKDFQQAKLGEITWIEHKIDVDFDRVSGIFSCDLDSDGDNDVLAAAINDDEIAWWRNDGGDPINWTKITITNSFLGAIYVFATDVDGDGNIDIIATAANDGKIAWWRNDGGDPISWTQHIIAHGCSDAHGIYACDLDNDGDTDIMATVAGLNRISWFENIDSAGDGLTWEEHIIDNNFGYTQSVYTADLDNDGFIDILGASGTYNEVAWWKNNGGNPISWTKHIIDNNFDFAHWVYAEDINRDGFIDVLGAAYSDNDIAWWKNNGGNPISWTKHIIDGNFRGAITVYATDVDKDGNIDVIGTAHIADDIAWWKNDGGNPINWIKYTIDSFFDGAWPVFSCDIDGDGDNDILGGADIADEIVWWESNLDEFPEKPLRPIGPSTGKPGKQYSFSSSTIDPNNDQIYYLFDWGDGNNSGWLGPSNSGETYETTYSWNEQGSYEIKVKAKDEHGLESEWSDPLVVSMPKNKAFNLLYFQFFERFIEHFPLLFLFLQFQYFNELIYNLEAEK